ncbi:MAG: hypothetical protein A2309_10675 [Bacteroidetes bacterium RIFOXYB2_FULL_35_7]|nr:MAG: hypothetical protein A2309_10675 [Bacteroidetes bacterium RIFOXYB2_FULL_35_7]
MKIIFFAALFIGINLLAYSQCKLDNIIPVKIGISKTEALNGIKAKGDIHSIYDFTGDPDSLKYNFTRKYKYMSDSAKVSRIQFKYKGNHCLDSDDNDVKLVFCNDKLFAVEITIYYTKDEFKSCASNYKKMLEEFKEIFPYKMEYDLTYKNKYKTVGEGFSFFKSKQESKRPKFERTDVYYRVKKVDSTNTEPEKVKKDAEMYVLEIVYTNLEYSEFNSSKF